jgi:hypothetical protein
MVLVIKKGDRSRVVEVRDICTDLGKHVPLFFLGLGGQAGAYFARPDERQ